MVGRRLRDVRARRGLSAQDVADLCAEVGVPELNRSVIANLENGRRASVSIEEVLVLAYVLRVPPVLMFTPIGTSDNLKIAPKVTQLPMQALIWASGEEPQPRDDQVTRELAAPIALTRRFIRSRRALLKAEDGSEEERRASEDMRDVVDFMLEAGMLTDNASLQRWLHPDSVPPDQED
jgi:transcriptional regulator with XRE-family HTH domain